MRQDGRLLLTIHPLGVMTFDRERASWQLRSLRMSTKRPAKHIKLTSHPGAGSAKPIPIHWGAADPATRGPIIATLTNPEHRNVIGTHSGSYAVYRALAIAARALDPQHVPDLTNTSPTDSFGPHPSWGDPEKIVSIDPWGAVVADVFKDY